MQGRTPQTAAAHWSARMRIAIVLALGLALGGVGLAAAPTATACTSDPDIVCGVIWVIGCVGEELDPKSPTAVIKNCP